MQVGSTTTSKHYIKAQLSHNWSLACLQLSNTNSFVYLNTYMQFLAARSLWTILCEAR